MKLINKIPTLILLLLSLTLLSSCLQRAPGSEGLTTENNSETEAPLMGLEYTLEMPSQELQEQFVNEYIAYQKYQPDTHPPFKMVSWYGSYGDIHFLMIEDGEYHDAEWTDRVADYSFEYSYGNQIKVWVKGQFLNIDDAYGQKFITKDMVAKIADVHGNKTYLYVNGSLDLTLSMKALIDQIENDYSSQSPSFDNVYSVKNYYGVYNGCIPIMFDVPESGAIRDVTVADIVIHYNGGNSILVWCDGEFLSLNEAYAQKFITKDMVANISDIHNNSKYLSMNANANQEFKLEMPSQELQERFIDEYVAYRDYDPEDNPIVAIESWYGSFGDIHFLLVFDAQIIYTQAHWTDIVAESSFSYPYGRSILVWVNEQFLTMRQAYEQNLITVDMIKTIENLHNGHDGSPIIMLKQ